MAAHIPLAHTQYIFFDIKNPNLSLLPHVRGKTWSCTTVYMVYGLSS